MTDVATPLASPVPGSLSKTGALPRRADVVVIGSGHNALVAALLLAREGKQVVVLEQKRVIGGACRTEHPFAKAPNLGVSTGAYLLGLMPPEVLAAVGVDLPLRRRDPHYFLPTTDRRYLLIGSDQASTKRQFLEFFSQEDWDAHVAMNEELGKLRDDLAPAWLEPPGSVEETAERFVRPEDLLPGRHVLLRKGAREYALVRIEEQ